MKILNLIDLFESESLLSLPSEKQSTWQEEHKNKSSTAVRRPRQTKENTFDIEVIKGFEITGLGNKNYVLSPLDIRSQENQKLETEINSILASLDLTKSTTNKNCKNNWCELNKNNLTEDRTVRNTGHNNNSNNYYTDENSQYNDYFDPQPPHHDDNWSPPLPLPPHYDDSQPPPPPPHYNDGRPPPPPPPPHHHHRYPPPPPPPPHHRGPPPPPPYDNYRSYYYRQYDGYYDSPPLERYRDYDDRRTRQSSGYDYDRYHRRPLSYRSEDPPPPPHYGGPPHHRRPPPPPHHHGPPPPPPDHGIPPPPPHHRSPPPHGPPPPRYDDPPPPDHRGPPPPPPPPPVESSGEQQYEDRPTHQSQNNRPPPPERRPPRGFEDKRQQNARLADPVDTSNRDYNEAQNNGVQYDIDVRFANVDLYQSTKSPKYGNEATPLTPQQFQVVAVTPEGG